jgi:hypothetical protein
MGQKIQVRRGATSDRTSVTFDGGEPVWDTSLKRLFVGDGTTPGGIDIAPPVVSFKNKIINGSFDIPQRGMSFSTLNAYGLDRWVTNGTGTTYTCSQFTTSPGAAYTSSAHGVLYTITSVAAAGNYLAMIQRIEGIRPLSGKIVTISFIAYAAVSGKVIGVNIEQNFGVGGSTFAPGLGQSVTLSSTPTKYSLTFSVPSITGKTVGTSGDDRNEIVFWLDAGSTFNSRSGSCGQSTANVAIHDVQVEIGSTASDFEQRPFGQELILCQRYFQKSFGLLAIPAIGQSSLQVTGIAYAANTVRVSRFFTTRMRGTPSVQYYADVAGGTLGQAAVYNHATSAWQFAVPVNPAQLEDGFQIDIPVTSTQGGAYMTRFNWTADSEL